MEKFTENPINFVQDMINKMEEARDYTLKYYREPIDEGYPEIEGVSFILNEILGLKDPSTNNIASILKKYIDYIKEKKNDTIFYLSNNKIVIKAK